MVFDGPDGLGWYHGLPAGIVLVGLGCFFLSVGIPASYMATYSGKFFSLPFMPIVFG